MEATKTNINILKRLKTRVATKKGIMYQKNGINLVLLALGTVFSRIQTDLRNKT